MSALQKYSVVCLSVFIAQSVHAIPAKSADWHGFYLGATAGSVWSRFEATTSTQPGPALDAIQANAVNHAGNQTLTSNGFITGITGGYNWQLNHYLLGLEGDIQSLSVNGTINSGAILYPNKLTHQFVLTTYGSENWLFTARPRLGYITEFGVLYATAGWATAFQQTDFLFTNNKGDFESQRVRKFTPGYALGAGVETGLSSNVSMKLDYLYTNFGTTQAEGMNHDIAAGQHFKNKVRLTDNIVRVGVNYHFNNLSAFPALLNLDQWKIEIGARPFYSTGNIGAPQPLYNNPGETLASRLTFKNVDAATLESYIRLDHASGFFAKGYLGAGTILNGQLNDEDFPAGGAYSNTLSSGVGNLSYATVDAGYSLFNTPTAKSGVFIGYNYYAQNMNVYNCRQLTFAGVCADTNEFSNFLGLSEDDKYTSLRVGYVTHFDVSDRVGITAEAAYLPIVNFTGQDLHNARQLIGPEQSNNGDGSMLESVLTYQFSDNWNVGIGARYWMWNMHTGNLFFDFMGESADFMEPARFNTRRYGAFIQFSYLEKPLNHFLFTPSPFVWRGLYVGGNLGGAWGYSDWTDPFGPTLSPLGVMNKAQFGDHIYSTGPLGGMDVHYYWQVDKYVFGIGGTAGAADMRGENTLFSGLGGVNGQGVTNRYITLVAKLGLTYDRSLFYVNVGPALLRTQYHINANTGDLTLGAQSVTQSQWGATIGAGIDYALTEHWTTNVEYDFIRLAHSSINFGAITTIQDQSYAVSQTMNVAKVGLNYKFG